MKSGYQCVVLLLATFLVPGCAGSSAYYKNLATQDLTELSDSEVCKAFNFDGKWKGRDVTSFKAEVRRRMLDCSGGLQMSTFVLGTKFLEKGDYKRSIKHLNEAIRINPNYAPAQNNLGKAYIELGDFNKAIAPVNEALRLNPDYAPAHNNLGILYSQSGRMEEAAEEFSEALRINYDFAEARKNLNDIAPELARVKPSDKYSLPEPSDGLSPKLTSGSGFFVSKLGHVVTNAHVVKNCKRITVGDNANKQVSADVVNTDRSNDLALLKLSSLVVASAESRSLIDKLGIAVVPLASGGLLRSDDVRLGEKVLVAGYPFGDIFSNTIKVTAGIVSATRGSGDDSGQFQLDAAVQPGNSGGPIYDSSGNIVGVVISQLDKLEVANTMGSMPENVNFGIKASTVRQFLFSSGLPSKKAEQTTEKSTEQLAVIARNQTLMVRCLK